MVTIRRSRDKMLRNHLSRRREVPLENARQQKNRLDPKIAL